MRFFLCLLFIAKFFLSNSQNDADYIRMARIEPGGSSRFLGMGGAMGALGADLSTASNNPSGLGLFTRFDLCIGFGFLNHQNHSTFQGNPTESNHFMPLFTTFGLAMPYPGRSNPNVRNILAFSVHQLLNFNSTMLFSHTRTKATLNRDMLASLQKAQATGNDIQAWYEGLGFNSYLLDFDSLSNSYFSFSDTAIPVSLNRKIIHKGRINETAFSFAQSVGDEWYWGITLGIQNIRFEHDMTHSEADDQNQMQIVASGTTVSYTYLNPPPFYYDPLYGFKNFTYREYYKTSGKGMNLKGGFIYRISPDFRFGMYAHSPTFFDLSDQYQYSMSTTFDGTITSMEARFPDNEGLFNYSMSSPWRWGASAGYILNKKMAFGVDVEMVSYTSGRFSQDDYPSLFDGVNDVIQGKYKSGYNLRAGMEYNLYPYLFRAGYIHLGNPSGKIFQGNETVHVLCAGAGLRRKYLYIDAAYTYRFEKYDYYPYLNFNDLTRIQSRRGCFTLTLGYKF